MQDFPAGSPNTPKISSGIPSQYIGDDPVLTEGMNMRTITNCVDASLISYVLAHFLPFIHRYYKLQKRKSTTCPIASKAN